MKIKSRTQREKEYEKEYGTVSTDIYERLNNELGSIFNENLMKSALERIENGKKNIEYNMIRFVFYEKPIQSHRPRVNYGHHGLHVPNAKANSDAVEKFIKKFKKDLKLICTPMKIIVKAYYPMPKNVKPLDMILYETEHDYAIGKPDFDNVLKAYTDMLQKHILLDDDLVSSSSFDKYYSLKPRVELKIIYTNGYASEYTYKTIINRKSFKNIKDFVDVELLVNKYTKSKRKGNKENVK